MRKVVECTREDTARERKGSVSGEVFSRSGLVRSSSCREANGLRMRTAQGKEGEGGGGGGRRI